MFLIKSKEKRILFLISLIIALLPILFIVWLKLPPSINRRSDIQLGNKVIFNIEQYKRSHPLPEDTDWETLRRLGFIDKGDFLLPSYTKLGDTSYELAYIEGFDGPYLLWNSIEKKWRYGNLSISTISTEDKVVALVEKLPIVKSAIKIVDSLSAGKRRISLRPTLSDTANNIYKVRVCEDNGDAIVTYYRINVDANKMIVLNPTGATDDE